MPHQERWHLFTTWDRFSIEINHLNLFHFIRKTNFSSKHSVIGDFGQRITNPMRHSTITEFDPYEKEKKITTFSSAQIRI